MGARKILHLDNDWDSGYAAKELADQEIVVVPEMVPSNKRLRLFAGLLPDTIEVRREEALDARRDHMIVYHPTDEMLRKIHDITRSQSFDWIVVGNNRGAGIQKVEAIDESMRSRVIITANGFPRVMDYEPLGCLHFSCRLYFGKFLRKLIDS